MRRIQTGVIAVCLAAAFLSGCAGSSAQSTASSTAASSAAASSVSTYQKAHSDLLSTIAVFAAHYGEL